MVDGDPLTTEGADPAALFTVAQAATHRPGQAEAGLRVAVEAGQAAGTLVDEDSGLIGSAFVGARALDAADRQPGPKTGYLVAALLTPYRETLQALRLPAAITPSDPRAPSTNPEDTSSSLRDLFGTAD
jgi:hypothetical protein